MTTEQAVGGPGRPSLSEVVTALEQASPDLDADGRRIAVSLYRLLASGTAPTVEQIASHADVDHGTVQTALSGWPGVFVAGDRVVGFWGLALADMPHRFEVDGVETRTWCAWDPLFIAPILGVDARVESSCPVSGRLVTLTVGPGGVRDLDPPGAVMSFLSPTDGWTQDVITTFCHYVLLFASQEAAGQWTAQNPGTFVVGVDEGFEIGRRWRRRFEPLS